MTRNRSQAGPLVSFLFLRGFSASSSTTSHGRSVCTAVCLPSVPASLFSLFRRHFPHPSIFLRCLLCTKRGGNARCSFPHNSQRGNFLLACYLFTCFKVLRHLLPPPLILFLPRSSSSPFPPHALLPMWRILGGGMLLLLLFSSYLPV